MAHEEVCSDFYRDLNIEKGIATTTYAVEGVTYTREVFCSYPDQVIAIKMSASQSRKLSFKVELCTPHAYKIEGRETELYLVAEAPAYAAPVYHECDEPAIYDELSKNRGITFGIGVEVEQNGGTVYLKDNALRIEGADEAVLYLTIHTNFEGYNKQPIESQVDIQKEVTTRVSRLKTKTYEQVKERHIRDYSNLYDRVELHIEGENLVEVPTDERLELYIKDTFDVGYILICLMPIRPSRLMVTLV